MSSDREKHLHERLIKLGERIGDGDHEKWVEVEYRKVLKELGIIPKRQRRISAETINKAMIEALRTRCCECGGKMKQTRSGSMRAICTACGNKYQILKTKKRS
jgi:predicted nucleic acid-binding Zn ribbon protein